MTRSVDESLARLGVEYVDFIQVHDMEFGSIDQIVTETIPALRQVQAAGKVRFVGISCLPLKLYRQVMDRVEVDQVQSYCHHCLNDFLARRFAAVFPWRRAWRCSIPRRWPCGCSAMPARPTGIRHSAELRARCAEAAQFCREHGSDLGRLALQFAVANPAIPTNIVGAADPQRVLANIRDIEQPLDEELLAAVLEILRPRPQRHLALGRA